MKRLAVQKRRRTTKRRMRKTQTLSVDSRKVHREHRTLSLENGFRADYAKEKEFLNVSLVFRRPGGSPL